MTKEALPVRPTGFGRRYEVEDLHLRSDGSGRVVEAYAAVFNTATAVIDQDGHYNEVLTPTSFAKTIAEKSPTGFSVLFNHGRTIDGTPNPEATLPIAVPLEVVTDERGVFTASQYLDNPLADRVLGAIKGGAIRAQSFSGRFTKSLKSYPDGRARGALPLITRQEVDMREYGPAVFAAYEAAAIMGTRSVDMFLRALLEMPRDKVADFIQQFEGLTTLLPEPEALPVGTPIGAAAPLDEPALRHSSQPTSLRSRIQAERHKRGME
jgi:HK97 family phage prohead protease